VVFWRIKKQALKARRKKARKLRAFLKSCVEINAPVHSDELLWHFLSWLFAFLWLGGCVVHDGLSS
jgi:hypothetical protein